MERDPHTRTVPDPPLHTGTWRRRCTGLVHARGHNKSCLKRELNHRIGPPELAYVHNFMGEGMASTRCSSCRCALSLPRRTSFVRLLGALPRPRMGTPSEARPGPQNAAGTSRRWTHFLAGSVSSFRPHLAETILRRSGSSHACACSSNLASVAIANGRHDCCQADGNGLWPVLVGPQSWKPHPRARSSTNA